MLEVGIQSGLLPTSTELPLQNYLKTCFSNLWNIGGKLAGYIEAKRIGFRSNRKPKKAKSMSRICVTDGCEKRLSQYNNKKYCYAHHPITYPRIRGHLTRHQGE